MNKDKLYATEDTGFKRFAAWFSNHPYVLLLMIVLGVAGFFLTIQPLMQGPEKQLSYKIMDTAIISSENFGIDGVAISYYGQTISSLVATSVHIKNTGRKPIVEADIPSMSPFLIELADPSSVLGLDVISSSNIINNIQANWIQGDNNIAIEFEYINPNDEFVLQILRTEQCEISISVTIIGETNPLIETEKNPSFFSTETSRRIYFFILAPSLLLLITFLATLSYIKNNKTRNFFFAIALDILIPLIVGSMLHFLISLIIDW